MEDPASFPIEVQLSSAISAGLTDRAARILDAHRPDLNINWRNGHGRTLLHYACESDDAEAARRLLAWPGIDVNSADNDGKTAFMEACVLGSTNVAKVLLDDPRVDITRPDNKGYTPVRLAAETPDIILGWIASGRELPLPGEEDADNNDWKTNPFLVLWHSENDPDHQLYNLLVRFANYPEEVRREVRRRLHNRHAADVFAPAVFLSDGLLRLKAKTNTPKAKRTRFFRIMAELPLELQMLISHRAVGSMRNNIPGEDSELGFRRLVKGLSPSPPL
jgi:hypothetical protein